MSSSNTPLPFTLEIDAADWIGERQRQEDSFQVERSARNGSIRIAVADGLGGHAHGKKASEAAVRRSMEVLQSDDPDDATSYHALFRTAFLAGDQAIRRIPWHHGEGRNPASTLINAIVYPSGEVWLAGIGDSIAWALTDGHVRTLLRAQGERGWVHYALGDDTGQPEGSAIEHASWQMQAGDRLLIATDGILSLSQPVILNTLSLTLADPAWTLMAAIKAKGHEYQDNCAIVTVTAVEITR